MSSASSPKPRRRILKKDIPGKWRLPLVLLLSLASGLGLSLADGLIRCQSLGQTLSALWTAPLPTLACGLFLGLLILFITLVSRSLFAGGLSVSLLLLVASFVNYFKTMITATPLQLSDLALVTKLGQIAELNGASITFSGCSILAIAAVFCWVGILFILSRPLRLPWKLSLPCAGGAALAFFLLFGLRSAANAWLYTPLYVPVDANYGAAYVTGQTGPVLGLWRSVLGGGEEAAVASGSQEEKSLLEQAQELAAAEAPGNGEKKPHVIAILAESFFDLTELPGVTYDADPLADFHRAQAEGVSGTFHTRTLGYGTCSIEMEVLTGINTRYFSADQLLSEWDPAAFDRLSTVPRLFQENGYYTAYLHTFNDSIYNRTPTYSHLGFDSLYFSGDFAQIMPEAAQAEENGDYWGYMYSRLSGGYYSDDLLADALIDLYEREGESRPVFLWAATVENHTPFTADKYDSYDYAFTADLSEEAQGVLNSVTQGAANCSKALGKLMDYFSACDEPVVIVFFGDHRPGLPLESGGSIYSALGLAPENSADWSLEQLAALYATDYVLWSNDESLLPAPAGTKDQDSSSNYLGLDILRMADIRLDGYWRMLSALRQDCLVWTWDYFLAADGCLARLPEECLDEQARKKVELMTWLMRQAYSQEGEEPLLNSLTE